MDADIPHLTQHSNAAMLPKCSPSLSPSSMPCFTAKLRQHSKHPGPASKPNPVGLLRRPPMPGARVLALDPVRQPKSTNGTDQPSTYSPTVVLHTTAGTVVKGFEPIATIPQTFGFNVSHLPALTTTVLTVGNPPNFETLPSSVPLHQLEMEDAMVVSIPQPPQPPDASDGRMVVVDN